MNDHIRLKKPQLHSSFRFTICLPPHLRFGFSGFSQKGKDLCMPDRSTEVTPVVLLVVGTGHDVSDVRESWSSCHINFAYSL